MLKLYGATSVSRAGIIEWYLKELGVDWEFIALDMKEKAEHKQADFLKINPMGKIPAIVDGDFKMSESGAILLYVAEKYGKMPDAIAQRGLIYQWVLFSNSTLYQGVLVEENREKQMAQILTALNQTLAQQPYLIGEEFSVADVAVGSILGFAVSMLNLDFSGYPAVSAYIEKLVKRPAYKETLGKVPA
ncbi:MAG: glutathione S-transferase family protein [Prochloraceae cyanobacterium]|nr:glutathione S-transferase family protein [Prochloraceae cyanobacterium]